MKRLVFVSILFVFFGLSAKLNTVLGQENNNYFIVEVYSGGFTASSVPESFRNIPIHEDDGTGLSGLISKNSYDIPIYGRIGYRKIFVNNKRIRLGYDIVALLSAYNLEEKSYVDSPGFISDYSGSSSSFCGTTLRGPTSLLGLKFFVPEINIVPGFVAEYIPWRNKMSPTILMSASYMSFVAVNGWDRKGFKTIFEQKILAYTLPVNIGLGISILEGDITINPGINLNFMLKPENAKEFQASSRFVNAFLNLNFKIVDY
ncbi:MAG: hypothetical protein ACOYL8_02280 [Patescibacteria group bacterium]